MILKKLHIDVIHLQKMLYLRRNIIRNSQTTNYRFYISHGANEK